MQTESPPSRPLLKRVHVRGRRGGCCCKCELPWALAVSSHNTLTFVFAKLRSRSLVLLSFCCRFRFRGIGSVVSLPKGANECASPGVSAYEHETKTI